MERRNLTHGGSHPPNVLNAFDHAQGAASIALIHDTHLLS